LTPSANPLTSASGSSERADHHAIEDHRGLRPSSYTRAAAMPTTMCPTLAIVAESRRPQPIIYKEW
jgi:hypothetical protein